MDLELPDAVPFMCCGTAVPGSGGVVVWVWANARVALPSSTAADNINAFGFIAALRAKPLIQRGRSHAFLDWELECNCVGGMAPPLNV
jgi:hypothetical protein